MSFIEDIAEKLVGYETETGKKPASVYLGRAQMNKLESWAKHNGLINDGQPIASDSVLNCQLYRVDADDHLGCA